MNSKEILRQLSEMLAREDKLGKTGENIVFHDYEDSLNSICIENNVAISTLYENVDEYIETNNKKVLRALRRMKVYNGRILFCKIGWASFYNGDEDDKPQGGGSFNENNVDHEALNFNDDEGKVYGFVQHANSDKASQIKIERLDSDFKGKESIDDTLIVWVAQNPESKEVQVVGWYRNATLFRNIQECKPDSVRYKMFSDIDIVVHDNEHFQLDGFPSYRMSCNAEDATLLPLLDRNFSIRMAKVSGDGGIGKQSPVWYGENALELVLDVIDYIYDFQTNNNQLIKAITYKSLEG